MRKPELKSWDYLAIAAVVVLIGVFVVDLVVPNPSMAENAKRIGKEEAQLQVNLKNESDRLESLQTMARNRLWRGAPEQVSPQILQEVTKACSANGVAMSRFRPQRTQESGELDLLGFTFNAEGRFPQVMQMIRSLESSNIRMAVTQTNLSSASEEDDRVTALISIAVYVERPKEEEAKKTNG